MAFASHSEEEGLTTIRPEETDSSASRRHRPSMAAPMMSNICVGERGMARHARGIDRLRTNLWTYGTSLGPAW